jgi:hypothetical protein
MTADLDTASVSEPYAAYAMLVEGLLLVGGRADAEDVNCASQEGSLQAVAKLSLENISSEVNGPPQDRNPACPKSPARGGLREEEVVANPGIEQPI